MRRWILSVLSCFLLAVGSLVPRTAETAPIRPFRALLLCLDSDETIAADCDSLTQTLFLAKYQVTVYREPQSSYPPADVVIVAGHGAPDRNGRHTISQKHYLTDDLLNALYLSNGQAAFFLDTCFAGLVVPPLAMNLLVNASLAPAFDRDFDDLNKALSLFLATPGKTLAQARAEAIGHRPSLDTYCDTPSNFPSTHGCWSWREGKQFFHCCMWVCARGPGAKRGLVRDYDEPPTQPQKDFSCPSQTIWHYRQQLMLR